MKTNKYPNEIRDPVHGYIYFSDEEKAIIDTPVFQRLRRIKQLALTNLIYPGANHTRFEHSIGAMEIAGRIAMRLEFPEKRIRIIRLAALLHDLDHSHTFPMKHFACVEEEKRRKVVMGFTKRSQPVY